MPEVWTQVLLTVVSTIVATLAGGILTWLWQSYRRIRDLLTAAGELLDEQKKTNKLLSGFSDQLADHEARIENIEGTLQQVATCQTQPGS